MYEQHAYVFLFANEESVYFHVTRFISVEIIKSF